MIRILILILVTVATKSLAQTDMDVMAKDVPNGIKEYIIKEFPNVRRVRFFKEVINDTVLYEAAFKYNREKIELIFLSDNELGSMKKQIHFFHLNEEVQSRIIDFLKSKYLNFSILKVKEIKTDGTYIYELKTRLKTPDKSGFYEIYFNKDGVFLHEKEEVLKSIPANTGF